MTYTLRLLPELEEDSFAGYAWYEEKAIGLGEDFLRMFYACAAEIQRNPLQYPRVYGEFRRCLTKRFPYAVYYELAGNDVTIVGLFHCARRPRTINSNLRGRNSQK